MTRSVSLTTSESTVAVEDETVLGPAGFWSYAHKDDEQVKGRIVRLAGEIGDAYSLLTGEELRIFLDRQDLEWGHQWRARIEEALQETTFFIPIITPRYFKSTECRRELLKFLGHAASLGAQELLLPILFVDVDDLEEDSTDEAKAIIAKTQYADWRDLRLTDEASEAHQRAVTELAKRLVRIGQEYAARPTMTPAEIASIATDAGTDAGDTPGFLDLMAEMEAEIPAWIEAVQGLPEPIREIGTLVGDAAAEIQAADTSPKPFAQRILIVRKLADRLRDPAAKISRLGDEYATHLVGVDAGMRAFITQAEEENLNAATHAGVASLFNSVLEMARNSRTAVTSLKGLVTSMEVPAKQSKDLRPVLFEISQGLRAVLDGQTVLDEWERLIRETGLLADDEA